MLPPGRPGNCVARQHWLQTQGQELLLLTLMAALCLRGGSCQHCIEGISVSWWCSCLTLIAYSGTVSRPNSSNTVDYNDACQGCSEKGHPQMKYSEDRLR